MYNYICHLIVVFCFALLFTSSTIILRSIILSLHNKNNDFPNYFYHSHTSLPSWDVHCSLQFAAILKYATSLSVQYRTYVFDDPYQTHQTACIRLAMYLKFCFITVFSTRENYLHGISSTHNLEVLNGIGQLLQQ